MKDFIFKIRHYGIKRMLPQIVIKNVYATNVVCDNPYTAYYQIKKEGDIYHFRRLKKISKHLYVTTYRTVAYGIIPSTVKKIS